MFGLHLAFQVVGTATVLMSLWSVEDQAARQWIKALYEGRRVRKVGTAEAVREVSLRVLRERPAKGESTHSFYWGAFVGGGIGGSR